MKLRPSTNISKTWSKTLDYVFKQYPRTIAKYVEILGYERLEDIYKKGVDKLDADDLRMIAEQRQSDSLVYLKTGILAKTST